MESIKQFFRITEFVAQEALSSMGRSGWMSWLVVATITVSLSILGGAWLIVQDMGNISQLMGAKVTPQVFVANDGDAKAVMAQIQQMPDVKGVSLKTKEQAWTEMKQTSMKTKLSLDSMLEENPLPDTITVDTTDPAKTLELAERIRQLPGVEQVEVGKELLDKIGTISDFIRAAGVLISGLLGVASLTIIMNTIRLAVMSRRREIEIMHLVGASNAFIAWPFLLEGMLFGLFGAALTGLVLFGWRYFTFTKWQELFPFLPMVLDYVSTTQLLGCLALIGMGLGALGSLLSVRKHIRLAMAD